MSPQKTTESFFLKNLAKNIAGTTSPGMNYLKQIGGSYMEGGRNVIQGIKDSSSMIQEGQRQMSEGKTLGEQFKGLAKEVGGALYGGLRTVGEVAKTVYAPIAPIVSSVVSPVINKTVEAGAYMADKSGLADYFGDKLQLALPMIDKVSKWAKDNPYKIQVAKDILYTTSLIIADKNITSARNSIKVDQNNKKELIENALGHIDSMENAIKSSGDTGKILSIAEQTELINGMGGMKAVLGGIKNDIILQLNRGGLKEIANMVAKIPLSNISTFEQYKKIISETIKPSDFII